MNRAPAPAAAESDINQALADLEAGARVRWALQHLPGRAVLSSSFGAQAAVSLHPRSGQASEEALRAAASQAFVSGSGPAVIAFVPTEDAADAVQRAWQDSRCVDRIIATNAPARPIVHITA